MKYILEKSAVLSFVALKIIVFSALIFVITGCGSEKSAEQQEEELIEINRWLAELVESEKKTKELEEQLQERINTMSVNNTPSLPPEIPTNTPVTKALKDKAVSMVKKSVGIPTITPEPEFTTKSMDALIKDAKKIPYDELSRNTEKYVGDLVHFIGKVGIIYNDSTFFGSEEKNATQYKLLLRVNYKKGWGWSDDVIAHYNGQRVLEEDVVEFVGRVERYGEWYTVQGPELTIAKLRVVRKAGNSEKQLNFMPNTTYFYPTPTPAPISTPAVIIPTIKPVVTDIIDFSLEPKQNLKFIDDISNLAFSFTATSDKGFSKEIVHWEKFISVMINGCPVHGSELNVLSHSESEMDIAYVGKLQRNSAYYTDPPMPNCSARTSGGFGVDKNFPFDVKITVKDGSGFTETRIFSLSHSVVNIK